MFGPGIEHLHDRVVDSFRRSHFAEVLQHQHGGFEQRQRIRLVLAGNVGRAAVYRFEDRAGFADVRAGDDAQPAHESRGEIGNDVTVEIFEQQDVELLRVHHHLHAEVVDDLVVRFDVRILLRNVAEALQEKAVRQLHDVGLVHGGDALASVRARVLERELRDARRGAFGDDLDRLDHARDHFVFESAVQVLGVLAHDDDVDVFEARDDVRHRLDRPQIRVEIERLAQPDIDRREAGADRRRDRTFERDLVAEDRFKHLGRQRIAEARYGLGADEVLFPFDVDAGAFDDRDDRGSDFGADAVTGQQRDLVFRHHESFPLAHAPWRWRTPPVATMRAPRIRATRRYSDGRSPASEG